MGTAVGCSALAASASSQLAGRRKSMTGSLLRLVRLGVVSAAGGDRRPNRSSQNRVRRARLVHVLFTWSEASTQRLAPARSVTETMKELAGRPGHLVDSYERRSSVTSSFSCGNVGNSLAIKECGA